MNEKPDIVNDTAPYRSLVETQGRAPFLRQAQAYFTLIARFFRAGSRPVFALVEE